MIDFDDNCSKKCDLASSSSFAPRDSLSKLSLSSRLVVSSRQAKVSKLPLVFLLNEIVQYVISSRNSA